MDYFKETKMQQARDEIVAVLQKHELMGVVMFASQERAGFVNELSPPWSCVRTGPEGVQILSRREDFSSLEDQKKCVNESIGGIMGILHVSKNVIYTLTNLMGAVSHKMGIRAIHSDERIDHKRIE